MAVQLYMHVYMHSHSVLIMWKFSKASLQPVHICMPNYIAIHAHNLHTDVSSKSNVGAAVRLAHYSHHCNARCSSHWFGLQFRQQSSSVGMRYSCNDVHQAWLSWQAILAGNLALQPVKYNIDILLKMTIYIQKGWNMCHSLSGMQQLCS